MADVLLEVCVDDVAGLNNAVAGGADRIELCSALTLGGLTPSAGLIKSAAKIPIPVYAMIRPRAGDFVYSSAEIDLMRHDIDVVLEAGLAGIVLGVLKINNHLEADAMHALLRHATGLETTLHRAIDLVPNISDAIEIAVSLGFTRILTSGGNLSALEGSSVISQMLMQAKDRISIMAGAGITAENVAELLRICDLQEIHASCSIAINEVRSKLIEYGFANVSNRQTAPEKITALKMVLDN